jgi:pimeloyl-ACP methyl ester carboxylesterase
MQAQINGITLHYHDQGAGIPVLLVHAFPMNHALWQPQLDTLIGEARLIAPDLRGFGASEVPNGPYTMETFADDLAALLDQLQIERVVLAGVSMGGYIAFAFWRRYASRVRALVLSDTRASADTDEARTARESNAQLAETQGARVIADMMLPNLLSATATSEVQNRVRDIIVGNQPYGIASALRGMALRPDSSDLLPAINVPTLLLVGSEDGLTSPDEMRSLEQRIAGSRLVEVPGAGHLPNFENPDAFNAALREFLRGLG